MNTDNVILNAFSQFQGGIYMVKENRPLLSDEFLDELANEINQLYGKPIN